MTRPKDLIQMLHKTCQIHSSLAQGTTQIKKYPLLEFLVHSWFLTKNSNNLSSAPFSSSYKTLTDISFLFTAAPSRSQWSKIQKEQLGTRHFRINTEFAMISALSLQVSYFFVIFVSNIFGRIFDGCWVQQSSFCLYKSRKSSSTMTWGISDWRKWTGKPGNFSRTPKHADLTQNRQSFRSLKTADRSRQFF